MKSIYISTSVFLVFLLLATGCTPSDAEKQAQKMEQQQTTEKNQTLDQKQPPLESKNPIESATSQGSDQSSDTEQQNKTEQLIQMQNQLREKTKQLEEIQAELDYYKKYVKDVTLTLPPEKLQELVKKEWNYAVTINSIQFPTSGVLDIQEHVFKIVFTEERVKYSVLPDTESQKGKISGELAFAVSSSAIPIVNKDNNITSLTYEFKDLKAGDKISIHINDELKSKLNVATNDLVVTVVK